MIHNQTVPSSDLITNGTFNKLQTLASLHEWNLAYNASEPARAIAGAVLAGQILDSLTSIVNGTASAPLFNAQFGAYGVFMSFFGLADLPKANSDFYGICDYASSMTFELITNSTAAKPSADDISVRFLFSNGTASQHGLTQYPLFGGSDQTISWKAFSDGMSKFAVTDNKGYCGLCGSSSAVCAANSTASTSGNGNNNDDSGSGSSSGGMSKVVAGVIGALVTLVVVLGLEALVLLVGGLRLVKKSTLVASRGVETAAAPKSQ